MVDDAAEAGCECAKFQWQIVDDEMIPDSLVPGNAKESIWDIICRSFATKILPVLSSNSQGFSKK
jgi:N-acetylneuraminate synthase